MKGDYKTFEGSERRSLEYYKALGGQKTLTVTPPTTDKERSISIRISLITIFQCAYKASIFAKDQ